MDLNKIGQRISKVTNGDKQNYFEQQRNKLGGTYYPQEGLQPVHGRNDKETKLMQRLQNAKPDTLETRMYQSVADRRKLIIEERKQGVRSSEKVPTWSFDQWGNSVEEYI